MSGAGINIPVDFSPIGSMKAKVKDLKADIRATEKEMKALQDKGEEVTSELKQRYTEQNNKLKQYNAQANNSRARVNEFKRQQAERREGSGAYKGFERTVEVANEFRHAYRGLSEINRALGEDNALRGLGEGISGISHFLPAPFHIAGRIIGKALEFAADVGEAREAYKKGIGTASKELSAAGIGVDSSRAGAEQFRGQIRDELLTKEGGFLKNLRPAELGGKRLYDTLGPSDPELEAKIDAKVNEAISKIQAAKKEGYEQIGLGNFSEGSKKLKEANDLHKGAAPLWSNPAQIYAQLEAERGAKKLYAKSQMAQAASRTGD